jgi:transposase
MKVVDQESEDVARILWGFQGFDVEMVEVVVPEPRYPGEVRRARKLVYLRDRRKWHQCPCGRRHDEVLFHECEERLFRDSSLGDLETYVVVRPARLRCGKGTRVEVFPWAAPQGHRMTMRFFERIAALCRHMAVDQVCKLARLSWDTVAAIDMEATRLGLGGDRPDFGTLRWIGVDEVSRTGGHVYFTIVTDLVSGRVVYVGDGKREASLSAFFQLLGRRRCRQIRGVVSDLGGGFLAAIIEHIPHAKHVLDRFHIVQWANEALNQIRREQFGAAPRDGLGRELKVKKWILLSAKENLDVENRPMLARLEQVNLVLYRAYLLKEQLRGILHHPWKYFGALRRNLNAWCADALALHPEMAAVAKRIGDHIEMVVAGFTAGIRLGLVECINGKIALLRRQARGYRVVEYFKLKIYQRCSLVDDPYADLIL